jgi:hypothetical protein
MALKPNWPTTRGFKLTHYLVEQCLGVFQVGGV